MDGRCSIGCRCSSNFGALQKILHTPIADLWLKIGLYTECGVFLLYGILYMIYSPVKEEYEGNVHKAVSVGNPALNNLDKMLQDAEITNEPKKLSEGFQNWALPLTVFPM